MIDFMIADFLQGATQYAMNFSDEIVQFVGRYQTFFQVNGTPLDLKYGTGNVLGFADTIVDLVHSRTAEFYNVDISILDSWVS